MTVVPIFDQDDGFIGVWAQDQAFKPSMGSLAELGSLAEPTLNALSMRQSERTRNEGLLSAGDNIGFQDGVFVMIDGEKAPIQEVEAGGAYTAISYHGVPIAKRTGR